MKATILSVAMILLAITSTSNSLPVASSPEEAQSVIPLNDKPLPKDTPASDIPVVKSELKPEESLVATVAESVTKIEESKPVETELKSIEEKTLIVASVSGIEEPKEEVVAVSVAEKSGSVVKEENIARSAELEASPKVDEPAPVAPSVVEAEKIVTEIADASKGLISPISEAATVEGVQQPAKVEQEHVAIVDKEIPTELRSEIVAIEKEVIADVANNENKEEKVILESYESVKKLGGGEEVIEAVEKIVKTAEETPAVDNKAKTIEVAEIVSSQSEVRSAGSESAIEEAKEDTAKEAVKEEKKLDEAEYTEKKEEEKNKEVQEVKKEDESIPEEIKKPIEAEKLPQAEELKEEPKKPEDLKESSEESSEEGERSQEKKDKDPLNKTEDESSQEESGEKKSS